MARNILFSGLDYNEGNSKLMKFILEANGAENVIDFGSYIRYKNMGDDEIIESLNEDFDSLVGDSDVNIICHSMGCNIGLILAKERSLQIKKAAFLSPELQKTTSQEKKIARLKIAHNDVVPHDYLSQLRPTIGLFDKISLLKIFNQTKRLALESLEDIDNLHSIVAYGVADKFVSQKGAEELANKLDGEIMQVRTKHHNLLLSSGGIELANNVVKTLKL